MPRPLMEQAAALPWPSPAPSPAEPCSRGLLTTMHRVEELPPTAAGALLVGEVEHPAGVILVERNRVCWAAATGMNRRLHDILRSHSSLSVTDARLQALYDKCRRDHLPLGEALVAEGLVSTDQLRVALRQHTAESLLALERICCADCDAAWPLTWAEHTNRGYNPRFTFTAAEVLADVGARQCDELTADLVSDHLQDLAGTACAAVALAQDDAGAPLLVGAQPQPWARLDDLLDLADWAAAALAASPGFSALTIHAWAQTADGGALAWTWEKQRWAALCPDGPSLRALVRALDRQALALVLATKLHVLNRVRERTTSLSK